MYLVFLAAPSGLPTLGSATTWPSAKKRTGGPTTPAPSPCGRLPCMRGRWGGRSGHGSSRMTSVSPPPSLPPYGRYEYTRPPPTPPHPTLHATRETPHGAPRARDFCLLGEYPTCSVPPLKGCVRGSMVLRLRLCMEQSTAPPLPALRAPSRKRCVVNGQTTTRQATKEYATPPSPP